MKRKLKCKFLIYFKRKIEPFYNYRVCRAAQRCFVHTLDKIYGHGDKMGKELDDSLGVEKSGRVPSGPYNMHIDLFVDFNIN